MKEETIYFATTNKHKLKEVREILAPIRVEQADIEAPEPRSDSFQEVAEFKARYAWEKFRKPLIVEDAGIAIKALKEFPGPFSAYVFGKIGNEGILRLMDGKKDRTAKFISVISYLKESSAPVSFIGELKGQISQEIRGENGFGYDPIFIPESHTETMGEMPQNEKNNISHRRQSLEKFISWHKKRK